ncbi:MAG: hypothetical protein LBR68_00350 [Lachnoclostridium sp.]|nr:hypothetical protein [Lachnoclostridium sp.]
MAKVRELNNINFYFKNIYHYLVDDSRNGEIRPDRFAKNRLISMYFSSTPNTLNPKDSYPENEKLHWS